MSKTTNSDAINTMLRTMQAQDGWGDLYKYEEDVVLAGLKARYIRIMGSDKPNHNIKLTPAGSRQAKKVS